MDGGQGETIAYWDPENGADEDSVPTWMVYSGRHAYNWYAATAGSGNSLMVSANAQDSICPSGWMLPSSEQTGSKTWSNLVKESYGYIADNGTGNDYAWEKLRQQPTQFHKLTDGAVVITYQSSTSHSSNVADSLSFYSDSNGYVSTSYRLGKDSFVGTRCVRR